MSAESKESGGLGRRPRIVLLGATGYTGRLTAEALVRAGMAPVLAGRSHDRLTELAGVLAPFAPIDAAPTIASADVTDPRSVRALLHGPDDVLVTTVGPFTRLGGPALAAAIDAGCGYVDSTGEPPFVREVFERADAQARRTGARLLTAFGYDYVPGNLAGALAIARAQAAGDQPTRVDIGYFVKGGFGPSSGTKASAMAIASAPSFRFAGGSVVPERTGKEVRAFDIAGRTWSGLSIGGSEHFALPRLAPSLTEIGTYVGWAGRWTPVAARVLALAPLLPAGMTRRDAPTGEGPGRDERARARSVVVAVARDGVGRELARITVEGPSPYDLTADLLAWGAAMLATRRESGVGALGPADAFGMGALVSGCAAMGLAAVTR